MRSILTGVQGLVFVPESVGSELDCMCYIQSHRYACRCRFVRIGTVIELVGRMSLSDGLLVSGGGGGKSTLISMLDERPALRRRPV